MKSKIHEYQNKYVSIRKNSITILITFLITTLSFAQQGINYKAILKDINGNVLTNTFMNVQFTIHQTTASGTIVYQEDHNYTTDANGLLILTIGTDASPSVGTFATINWSADIHFLQTTITYSGGTINFDATEFKAVPYAKHAKTAETAANVFSGDYNDLINQPTTLPSGLEQITEDGNTGWRLIGRNAANYGNIGENAVDLSFSDLSSSDYGATGANSTAMGNGTSATGSFSTAMGVSTEASGSSSTAMGVSTEASGSSSTAMGSFTSATGSVSIAMGRSTEASGDRATAMGTFTTAKSYAETAIGVFSTDYTPISSIFWYGNDRIFNIGNGFSTLNRSDALTVLKNGTITAPSVTNSLINTAGDKALITKEYADANYLNTSSNLVPIAYGTIESDGNVLSSTPDVTASINAGVITISVNNVTMNVNNTSCSITPYSTAFRTSSIIISGGGDIQVRTFDSSGNSAPTTFQFVIYKL